MKEDLIRKLAEFAPTEMPVLSIYLDMRPQATGGNPGVRSGEIVLKDRLHEIEKTYLPRGEDLDSFTADRERIENFVGSKMSPATSGLIIFACSAKDLWEVEEVGATLENEVKVGKVPSLFQLAKMLDEYDTAVIAVIDTNTARFFVTGYGKLKKRAAPNDEDTKAYNKTSGGGWSQLRYQRIVENTRDEFSEVIVKDLEDLIEKVDAKNLIVAGDEIATTLLKNNLSFKAKEILYVEFLRIDIGAPRNEFEDEVRGILDEIESDDAHSQADKLVGAVRGDYLGVAGLKATEQALKNGQVSTLLLDPNAENLDENKRNELIRLAETTGAKIEIVENHEQFAALEGIGALLRYKI
ncbi:MAG: hypothetical protein M3033_03435 [Acidobacteriota bacterium]|nr:hypothetical protein [Acidobacteriota bacterium]